MGSGTFSNASYKEFVTRTASMSRDEIYTSRSIDPSLDPKGVKVRESRDSADNPKSTPIIAAIDVTGSMGHLAEVIARRGLGTLFNAILDRKPVANPHLMFMAVGDANCDSAPLQVSQFEADNRIVEQLTKIYIEGGGGGNRFESYNLPWYFAAFHTVHDSMEKRGKRGYLFTIGDERAPSDLTRDQLKRFIGDDVEANLSTRDMLEMAQRSYDVFHIVIEESGTFRADRDSIMSTWHNLLGQHVIPLADHTKLAETIVSAIEVAEGADAASATAHWGGDTAAIVHRAVAAIPHSRGPSAALPAP